MNHSELALILAALRLLQQHWPNVPPEILKIATDDGAYTMPTTEAIDHLCQQLNL